ncbi:zinc finger protein ZOP1-like [Salvia splendens]|uniref:zinc finger protein ZOP1-like n=1 Tax=Salvia splendens TaxID=180675 RepID=UPI001C252AEB|nr:zinc finger protein ZOP1-like [Salvia splendens]
MTEYWVSQGNKWCDTCKIYISNNPASIRNHEIGQRHKDSVAKRLNTMREDKAKKDKELKQAAKVLEQIEAKANRSYQKDLASFQEARETNAQALVDDLEADMPGEWEHDTSSGYYYNQTTGFHYDPNSGFYYSDSLGKWVPQEDALAAFQASTMSVKKRPSLGKPPSASESKSGSTSESGPPPGRLVSTPLNPMRTTKGAKSSVAVAVAVAVKRKQPDEKPKAVSKEEAAALKAREAARKRVEQREKPLLGLYRP